MKSMRGEEGGWRGQARRVGKQGAPLLLAAMALTMTSLACNRGGSSTEGAPQGVEPGANDSSGVVRYAGMETVESGNSSVRTAVQARRAADWTSQVVTTLYPGTVVTRLARYGTYSLVSWQGAGGSQQGWVDANVAFSTHWDGGVVVVDSGVPVPVFGTPVGNNPPAQPTVVAPPPTVVAPQPTVTAPPQPTPTVTVPPPKTATPPPPTTGTTKGGFKPPKLGH